MDKRDAVCEWLKYADNDLEAARQLLTFHPPKIEIICYLCQQSAEKVFKAFWIFLGKYPIKTHDLELLRNGCEEVDYSFAELAIECSRLNDYSSQPRYPFGLELTENDAQLAVKDSGKISEFVKVRINIDN